MTEHYNLKQIVSIKVFDFDLSENLFYASERKTWLGKIIPAHLEQRYSGLMMNIPLSKYDDIKISKHRVYFKPKIILYFSNESTQSLTFDTYKEATEKAESIKRQLGVWTT